MPEFALSCGPQQRLCIARTLAPEPELMLLDVPTSSLEPIATAKIEDLITKLSKDITILMVTHNMQQAARISGYTAHGSQMLPIGKGLERVGDHAASMAADVLFVVTGDPRRHKAR